MSVLTGALGMGRAFAESVMTDTCTIGTETEGDTIDPQTGQYDRIIAAPVYEGLCRFKAGSTAASEINAVGQLLVEQDAELSLPIATSTDVAKDMVAIIRTSATDPALPGVRVRIKAPALGAYLTARRFAVEITS